MAEDLRAIAEKIKAQVLQLESIRVAGVVREYEENRPSVSGECPICLDLLPPTGAIYLVCCGARICRGCDNKFRKHTKPNQRSKCPTCRGDYPSSKTEAFRINKEHALAGRPWAQTALAKFYEAGSEGHSQNLEEAMHWYQLAAKQNHAEAFFCLGRSHMGRESCLDAYPLLKKASDLGYSEGHWMLGALRYHAVEGIGEDLVEAARYFTLAFANDPDCPQAAYRLGCLFLAGKGGLDKSADRAKHYLERAALSDTNAFCSLGSALVVLGEQQYCGLPCIAGHDFVPRALYYLRKAAAKEDNDMKDLAAIRVADLESHGPSMCANCWRDSECFPEKMKRCTRCRSSWYCSRGCQRRHWKDGHKKDCIQSD